MPGTHPGNATRSASMDSERSVITFVVSRRVPADRYRHRPRLSVIHQPITLPRYVTARWVAVMRRGPVIRRGCAWFGPERVVRASTHHSIASGRHRWSASHVRRHGRLTGHPRASCTLPPPAHPPAHARTMRGRARVTELSKACLPPAYLRPARVARPIRCRPSRIVPQSFPFQCRQRYWPGRYWPASEPASTPLCYLCCKPMLAMLA